MTEAAAFAGVIQSFQAITNISKALLGLYDAKAIKDKAAELNREILAGQASAVAAQADQFALLGSERKLKEELARLKTWDTEKQKYELTNVRPKGAPEGSAFAYSLKENAGSSEPKHLICPNCYEDGRKSILQGSSRGMHGVDFLSCHRCGLEINLRSSSAV